MNSISQWQRILLQEIEEKELSPKQQKIAKLDPPANKIDAGDFKKLRGGAKIKEGESTWPKEVHSAYDEYTFKLANVMGNKAKYDIIDVETGEKEPGGRIFNSVDSLKQSAADLIKPSGGRQSSQFESVDHEVSMANNSIESIIKNAMDLKAKLGNDEKDIPAWIQDHITNAANFISQAAENYHEYGDHEAEETEDLSTSIMENEFISLEDFSKNLERYKKGDIIKSQLINSYNKLDSKDQEKAKELAKGQDVLPNPKKINEMSLQKIMGKINKNGLK